MTDKRITPLGEFTEDQKVNESMYAKANTMVIGIGGKQIEIPATSAVGKDNVSEALDLQKIAKVSYILGKKEKGYHSLASAANVAHAHALEVQDKLRGKGHTLATAAKAFRVAKHNWLNGARGSKGGPAIPVGEASTTEVQGAEATAQLEEMAKHAHLQGAARAARVAKHARIAKAIAKKYRKDHGEGWEKKVGTKKGQLIHPAILAHVIMNRQAAAEEGMVTEQGSVVESKEGSITSARNQAYNHPLSQKARKAHTKWGNNPIERRKGPNPTALDMHHAIQAHSEALAHHLSHVHRGQDPFDAHANQALEHLYSIKKILAFHGNHV